MIEENPYAAPEATDELSSPVLSNEEGKIPYKFGGPIARGLGKLIDFFIFGIIFSLCFGFFSLLFMQEVVIIEPGNGGVTHRVESNATNFAGMHGFLAALSLLIGGAICECFTGTTPGKLLFGLRVVRADEIATPSIGSALGRNIAMLFDGMFMGVPALFIMRTNIYQQRMGDIAARTFVVTRSSMPESIKITAKDYSVCLASLAITFVTFALIIVRI